MSNDFATDRIAIANAHRATRLAARDRIYSRDNSGDALADTKADYADMVAAVEAAEAEIQALRMALRAHGHNVR